ncbi:hypothetical protein ACTXL8_05040 [Glutamicibacter arilaitensis]|uniref:hypothetical protein n=1 Tax=Glutamicibacter arilaitensis TaxID=256701 RepID=UPI003FD5453E
MKKELMHASMHDAIEQGRTADAVAMAVLHDPDMLVEELDYHRITQDAQPYWDFAQEWIAAARVLDKPVIARWVADIALAEFAYLEIQCEAAQLLVDSVQEAKNYLASLIEDVSVLSDNPEAALTKKEVRELTASARELAELKIPGARS